MSKVIKDGRTIFISDNGMYIEKADTVVIDSDEVIIYGVDTEEDNAEEK